MIRFWKKLPFRQLWRNQDAVIAVEFAFLLPILLILSLGTIEVARFVQYQQKMDAGTSQLVNIINQNFTLSLADLSIIMDAATEIIRPYNGNNLTITITAIQQNADPAIDPRADVMWQVGRNTNSNPSLIAPDGKGSKIQLPTLQLAERDQVITVELFNQYTPLVDTRFTTGLIQSMADITYKSFIGRPRYGAFQFEPQ
jgi:Flp pilus assembly protein TadG